MMLTARFIKKTSFLSRYFSSKNRPVFNYEDPLNFQSLLNEDELRVQEIARNFAQNELMPNVTKNHRERHLDRSYYARLGSLGLIAPTLKGYNTVETSLLGLGLIARELEKVDSAYRSALGIQSALVVYAIDKYGSADQKQE